MDVGQGRLQVMKDGRMAWQGRLRKKMCRAGQGQVGEFPAGQVTGCQNALTCRPLTLGQMVSLPGTRI